MITALDFGAGNFKRFSAAGGIVIPSQVSAVTGEALGAVAGLKASARPIQIAINGYHFYVGAGAHNWGRPVENLDDSRFVAGSPELRALVYAALPSATVPQQVIVGLPQSALTAEAAAVTAAGLKSWLGGEHTWTQDGLSQSATVTRVTITSQAAGALFDYLLDDNAKFIPGRKAQFGEEIGVLSVGMNTVEFLVVRAGETLNRFTGSTTAGVRRLLELVDPQQLYSRGELDALLRAGRLPRVANAIPVWASEIAGHVERLWGKAYRRFAAVIVVGGGALLLSAPLLSMFNGKCIVPDDPVLAVGRGLYKLATMKANRSGASTASD